MSTKPTLSTWEKFTLLGAVGRLLYTAITASITGLFRGPDSAPTYKRHVMYTIVRSLTPALGQQARQALVPSTREVYEAFAKEKGQKPHAVKLKESDDTVACWIGDKNADVVLLFFHGGGYANTASRPHMKMFWNLVERVNKRGNSIAIFVVEYTMAPTAVYPRQLEQGALALQYLLTTEKRSYDQIILSGDSAGANLALALLSHVMHPHPSLTLSPIHPSPSSSSFQGLLLISPWVTFRQTSPSMLQNSHKDILNLAALQEWSDAFLAGAPEDEYNSPLMAGVEWWKDMPVDSVLITAGSDECFRDDIVEFAGNMQKAGWVELLVGEKECHDMPVMDEFLGISDGLSMSKVLRWVCERVGV